MSKNTVLIVWSNYYQELAQQQLDHCLTLLKTSPYDYQIETLNAGTYEIPAVIQHFQAKNAFDAYIPLSLLLKGSTDHYDFIWEHVKDCFTQLTLNGVIIGNAIISAPTLEILTTRVEQGERVKEAFRAVDYLLQLKQKNSPGVSIEVNAHAR